MKTLYIDCGMGAAGDMLTAALLELVPNADECIKELNALNIPGVSYTKENVQKCGVGGTHVTVKVHGEEEDEHMHDHEHEHAHHHHEHHRDHEHHHDHDHEHHHDHEHDHDHEHHHEHEHAHHHHSSMGDIESIINGLSVSENVKKNAREVYARIAAAESAVHGVPVTEIHFHEVGSLDAVADVVAVCMLMEKIDPQQVVVSPVHVGSGQVKCAHGILPVPAPATALILKDVPIYGGNIKSELCTPTGAALLCQFATKFGSMPVLKTKAIGYGMGKKDFEVANCVRIHLGETEEKNDEVIELSCNLDDMTPEALGYAMDVLLAAGALDVYTVSIGMKKNRPGVMFNVLCKEADREQMVKLLFMHTTTIGIRESVFQRYTLTRTTETVATAYGEVRKKISSGYGVTREKFEYEDLAKIAKKEDISIADVINTIK